jgi:adenosylcobyric acid synthase
METDMQPQKQLRQVTGTLIENGAAVRGYEIHMGCSRGSALEQPLLQLESGLDGARSDDDQVRGSYVHGLFDHQQACASLLTWAGLQSQQTLDYAQLQERHIDRLAEALEAHLDMDQILDIMKLEKETGARANS